MAAFPTVCILRNILLVNSHILYLKDRIKTRSAPDLKYIESVDGFVKISHNHHIGSKRTFLSAIYDHTNLISVCFSLVHLLHGVILSAQ